MKTVTELLVLAQNQKASDIHISVGLPPVFRINGQLIQLREDKLLPNDTKELVYSILPPKHRETLEEIGEVDCSYSQPSIGRYRVNAYKQRGSIGMALRTIPIKVPTVEELGNPLIFKELAELPRGIILVTGPTGSGKSTTLASMVNHINVTMSKHVLTLEDPIEYIHNHKKSMVNQREVGSDSDSFSNGLRAALREDPDVILVGEMRDLETISTALTAAETGHLVMSTLHTLGAAKTVDRVIDIFPPHQQQQIRIQFASVVQAIISQQLIPTRDGKARVPAFEIMVATGAIRNMIREGKTPQIDSAIQTGGKFKMVTMDTSLLKLYHEGKISRNSLLGQAVNKDSVIAQVGGDMKFF